MLDCKSCMAKIRTSIPSDLAADLMFASDNTCCVCRERGKTIQIHHIDENPDNNVFSNLAALCLECHNQTQISGGFGRKLGADLVIKYRDEWLQRVKQRRDTADHLAVTRQVKDMGITIPKIENQKPSQPLREPPLAYINSLPMFKHELLRHAQPEWDSGVTARMIQASYDYIDALQGILVTLAAYYAAGQFGGKSPQEFFSEIIASRFEWHRSHSEPHGPGTGGTIVNVICSSNVIKDVQNMVEDMVMSLVGYDDSFDYQGWLRLWEGMKSNK
jgi:hypothetical protein